jgi:phosphoserine phosphatase
MTLVAFDFDGTLSDDEMIVLLGEEAGCADEIFEITERAMAGELSYAESLRERASLLAGLEESAAERAYDGVRLRPGAGDLLRTLAGAGVPTAILTGGFEAGVEAALGREGAEVDRIVANSLVVEDGRLTGDVEGPLIEGTKDEALATVAAEFGVEPADAIAVGDGANDVPMLDAAGTAVGFRPKPAVRSHCDVVVATMDRFERVLAENGVL